MFENTLKELGLKNKLIKPYTLIHNEKVEISIIKDIKKDFITIKYFVVLKI